MAARSSSKPSRRRAPSMSVLTNNIEYDEKHHLTGPFMPQTPLGASTPMRTRSPVSKTPPQPPVSPWLKWAVEPVSALKVLVIPIILYVNWELLSPVLTEHVFPRLNISKDGHISNPFAPFFLLSNPVESSSPNDQRYAKSYFDLLFIAYYIVFWSLVRQLITIDLCRPLARRFGIRKEHKLDRFGEQGYAVIYFAVMGAWGYRIMKQQPTYWYQTQHFWIDYPHWDMKPELKRYYLMQMAYWAQQLIVMVLGLEKPRKDYYELVAHHAVTIWLVGWSYLVNLTLIGNAVYMSMDIPDAVLAFSKLLNYMRRDIMKVVSFAALVFIWSYFRHVLNWYILWSVWFEYDLVPEMSQRWIWEDGTYLVWWMKYQVFIPLFLLQLLNLFWYFLIMRILYRAVFSSQLDDDRSDDEDDGDDEDEKEKED